MVQLSHPYMTTGKTIALTRWTFAGKVMSLLFNMLSGLVTALLPRSKRLLISWLKSPSVVILGPKKIKSVTVSIVSPSICHEVMGQIPVKRREAKSKGEKERYEHLNAGFQRIARSDKKAFLRDQCKEIEENSRMGKTRDLFKKIRDTKGTFHAKRWTQ